LEGISAWRFGFEEVDGITFIVPWTVWCWILRRILWSQHEESSKR
jgi:hypothetical protein